MTIRFISCSLDHKVLLVAGRQLTDPTTGLPGQQIPNRYVHWKNNLVHEAVSDDEAFLLLQKWHNAEERKLSHSFWVHPSDMEAADELWETRKANPKPLAPDANYVKNLEDQIAELKAIVMGMEEKPESKTKKPKAKAKPEPTDK